METNAEYQKLKQNQLEEASKVAKGVGAFLAKIQSDIERAAPFSGPYAKPLTEFYLDLDELSKAYNELASECVAKAKGAKRAAEVEKRRHDNLKESVRTFFGFRV